MNIELIANLSYVVSAILFIFALVFEGLGRQDVLNAEATDRVLGDPRSRRCEARGQARQLGVSTHVGEQAVEHARSRDAAGAILTPSLMQRLREL